MKSLPRLYAIADAAFGDPVQLAAELFDAGAKLVQVRNKQASARELLEQVDRILLLAPADADVIVNDRADVALIAGAAGVHLGQTDLLPVHARRVRKGHWFFDSQSGTGARGGWLSGGLCCSWSDLYDRYERESRSCRWTGETDQHLPGDSKACGGDWRHQTDECQGGFKGGRYFNCRN
jgi:hypothetical protein